MPPRLFLLFALLLLWNVQLMAQEEGLDVRIFRAINASQNPVESGFFEYLDHTSLPTFAATPVGFTIVGVLTRDQAAVDAGLLSAFSQLATLGLTAGLKELVGRKRPFEELEGVHVKHRWSALGRSFPSGHSSQAFALATALSLRYRMTALTIPLVVWAAAIGYTRIYLGVHYPTDVLAGAVLGVVTAAAVWSLREHVTPLSKSLVREPETASGSSSGPVVTLVSLQIPLSTF